MILRVFFFITKSFKVCTDRKSSDPDKFMHYLVLLTESLVLDTETKIIADGSKSDVKGNFKTFTSVTI